MIMSFWAHGLEKNTKVHHYILNMKIYYIIQFNYQKKNYKL